MVTAVFFLFCHVINVDRGTLAGIFYAWMTRFAFMGEKLLRNPRFLVTWRVNTLRVSEDTMKEG